MAFSRKLGSFLINFPIRNELVSFNRHHSTLNSFRSHRNYVNSSQWKYFSSSLICRYSSNIESNSTAKSSAESAPAAIKQEKKDSLELTEEEKQQEKENAERQIRALKFSFYAFGSMIACTLFGMIYIWGAPQVDEKGNLLKDEFSEMGTVEQYLKRTYKETKQMGKSIKEPSREKLLPNPLTGMYIQPRYTLVLELKDVLVHPEWTYSNGWRFKKRPGIEYLLHHCGPPLFEIVIYTQEAGLSAAHVVDQLDPNGMIWYKLFKDTTNYVDGKHVKELSRLNRDLKRVIMVDWNGETVSCPRNQLKVVRWDGSMEDKGLTQLADLLRAIAGGGVDDVREVLDYYRDQPDPLAAFEKFSQEAQKQEKIRQEKLKEEKNNAYESLWRPSFLK